MLVRFTQGAAGERVAYDPGQEVRLGARWAPDEIPERVGLAWLACGAVERVAERAGDLAGDLAGGSPAVERADVASPEAAVGRSAGLTPGRRPIRRRGGGRP